MSSLIIPESRIKKAEVVLMALKRLSTFDGLGELDASKFILGNSYLVDIRTARYVEITNSNGKTHQKTIVDLVDENGKSKGWVYAECFFAQLLTA